VSRGYGHVQRLVLEVLDERIATGDPWLDVGAIAERFEGAASTRSADRSVRRALRLLAAGGVVELVSGERVRGCIAPARLDEVALRRARRERARELRCELDVNLGRTPPSEETPDGSIDEEQTCGTHPSGSRLSRA
jgi:hypothetical protein